MPETKYEWQEAYQEAVLEFSPRELPGKLMAAERAMFKRLHELSEDGNHQQEERFALDDALYALRVLKTEQFNQVSNR